ncbi:MAG: hypothetical protein MZV63_33035 [Marinilabiliales bacterium]|nr:hypothetical protein [Marinilabiliales bacterium]
MTGEIYLRIIQNLIAMPGQQLKDIRGYLSSHGNTTVPGLFLEKDEEGWE